MKCGEMQKDRLSRELAVRETRRSFVVEASAGTGKTRTLLDRILHLVLEGGRDGNPVPLSRICAITYTEKAAGEMKIRLRQELERFLLESQAAGDRLGRARDALDDLETASISTIHSFAVSLLKERPVEAGLDPHFTVLDELRGELFFRDTWDLWIQQALKERAQILQKALQQGFRLDTLERVARILCLQWLKVRDLECDAPPSEEECIAKLHALKEEGLKLGELMLNPQDKLAGHFKAAMDWLHNPGDGSLKVSKPGNSGAASNWRGKAEAVQAVRGFVNEVVQTREIHLHIPLQRLLCEVVNWIKKDFMLGLWEKRKRDEGVLDFNDQLRLARDLLLENGDVRREFHRRYDVVLVDEFQDTDPLQWEIVLLLSSTAPADKVSVQLKPDPGRLFIVGDPKQSIYRFRNADIETYLKVVDPPSLQERGLERLTLTTNHRSVPSILSFVDAAFSRAMQPTPEERSYQPEYLPFGGKGSRVTEQDAPSVFLLTDRRGEDEKEINIREFVERECSRVASLIQRMNGSSDWMIEDTGSGASGSRRVPSYGDIAVLLPVLTHVDVLEDKLRELGIPYVLEGGKFYYKRSEVSSAITVLRAIANPNDRVAIYGALRSIFFGLSDEDLLECHIDGLPLDYREEVPCNSPLHRPFEILRDLHQYRHERPASETFELLLHETGAREVLAVHGLQSLANLSKLGRTLRVLQSDMTFSQVVELMGKIDEEGLDESESRLMEERSNAVRVMTIHKSKGLDFPIVILAGLGLRTNSRHGDVFVDKSGKKIFALSAGSRDSGLRTYRWNAYAEEETKREKAELTRLLYVAMTRARDRMVISTHTAKWKKLEDSQQWLPDVKGTRLESLGAFLEDCYSLRNDLFRFLEGPGLDGRMETPRRNVSRTAVDWKARAEREIECLRHLLTNTPHSDNLRAAASVGAGYDGEDFAREDRMADAASNRGVRLGIAFHEAMQRIDIFAMDGPFEELLQELRLKHGLDPENAGTLEEMVRVSMSSELLSRARAAANAGKKVLREVPFVRPVESSAIVEGKIDLLFEEADGWVLVDYKTDRMPGGGDQTGSSPGDKYREQILEYVEALHHRSIRVSAAYLLLARTGAAIRVQ